jgi:hypothetical protein
MGNPNNLYELNHLGHLFLTLLQRSINYLLANSFQTYFWYKMGSHKLGYIHL